MPDTQGIASTRRFGLLPLTEDNKILRCARQGYVRAGSIAELKTLRP